MGTPAAPMVGFSIRLPITAAIAPGGKDTYVWLAYAPTAVQSQFVILADGAGQAPDTDAGILLVSIAERAQKLEVRYAKV